MDRMDLAVLLIIFLTQMQGIGSCGCTGGATYVRWGRNTCATDDSRLIYRGYAAGSHWNETGGGSNYICLPETPSWSKYSNSATGWFAYIWGAEYQINRLQSDLLGTSNTAGTGHHDNDILCAVCQSKRRSSVIMVPGKKECFNGWFREYNGMLMTAKSGDHHQKGRGAFVCMDANPEIRPGGQANHNDALFFFVQAKCGSLPCPPYHQNRELACVVCTN